MSVVPPLTWPEVASWLKETGCSLHIRYDGRVFVVIAHLASEKRAADCYDKSLEHATSVVMASF